MDRPYLNNAGAEKAYIYSTKFYSSDTSSALARRAIEIAPTSLKYIMIRGDAGVLNN